MPSVVEKETIIGSNLSQSEDGFEDTAIYRVTGLDAPGSEKKYQAITTPGLPQIGDPHPFIPGIVVRRIPRVTVEKGSFNAKVEVFYANPSDEEGGGGGGPDGTNMQGTVRLGVVYERVPSNYTTNLDGTRGGPIKLGINPDAAFNLDGGGGSGNIDESNAATIQAGEVNTYIARPTVILRGNTAKCPLSKGLKTGFTNADPFLDPIKNLFDKLPVHKEDTWMLIRTSSNSTDNNESFDFEFEWAYKEETWHEVAVFIDPATGRPPGNITMPNPIKLPQRGNGTLVVRVAGQAKFKPFVTLQ